MAHVQFISDTIPYQEYTFINIDGEDCQTLRGFYESLADAMEFPDNFGFTLDSMDAMLSDLSWNDSLKIAVYVKNSAHFLEKERNETKKITLLDRLASVCEDWRWMEPDEGEDDFKRKELKFLFDESDNIRELLAKTEE